MSVEFPGSVLPTTISLQLFVGEWWHYLCWGLVKVRNTPVSWADKNWPAFLFLAALLSPNTLIITLDLNSMVYHYTITGSKTMSLSWASSWLCHRFEPIVRPVSFYQYRSYRNRSLYVRSLIPSVSYPSPHRTMVYGGRMNVHIL